MSQAERVRTVTAATALALVVSFLRTSQASDEIQVNVTIKSCASGSGDAIAAVEGDACYVIDLTRRERYYTMSLCGGAEVGMGGKLVVGAEIKAGWFLCIDVKLPRNLGGDQASRDAIIKAAVAKRLADSRLQAEILKAVNQSGPIKQIEVMPLKEPDADTALAFKKSMAKSANVKKTEPKRPGGNKYEKLDQKKTKK